MFQAPLKMLFYENPGSISMHRWEVTALPEFNLTMKQALAYTCLLDNHTSEIGYGGGA